MNVFDTQVRIVNLIEFIFENDCIIMPDSCIIIFLSYYHFV